MKRNGFTLVELIATLVLMSMLATVILINMVGVKDEQDQRSATKFDQKVEEAACTYIDMKNQMTLREQCKASGCVISLADLIGKEGDSNSVSLIDPELEDKRTNKTAKDEKDTIKVKITFEGSPKEKKCKIQR